MVRGIHINRYGLITIGYIIQLAMLWHMFLGGLTEKERFKAWIPGLVNIQKANWKITI